MRCSEAPRTVVESGFPHCEAGAQSKDLPQAAKSWASSLQPRVLLLLPSSGDVTWASTPFSHERNWQKCQLCTVERSQNFDFQELEGRLVLIQIKINVTFGWVFLGFFKRLMTQKSCSSASAKLLLVCHFTIQWKLLWKLLTSYDFQVLSTKSQLSVVFREGWKRNKAHSKNQLNFRYL